MKTTISSAFAIVLLLSSGHLFASGVSGKMKVTNKTGGILNVIVTHFGCAGIVDGVATACSELPGGHKGYKNNIANNKSTTFTFENMGTSTGYGVVGKDTSTNQTYNCNSSINANITFKHNSGGKLTCEF